MTGFKKNVLARIMALRIKYETSPLTKLFKRAGIEPATSESTGLAEIDLFLENQKKVALMSTPKGIGADFRQYLTGTSGEFSPTPKNTVVVPVVDSITGLGVETLAVEVGGALGSMAAKGLIGAYYFDKVGSYTQFREKHPKFSANRAGTRFGATLAGTIRKYGRAHRMLTLPTLAKTLVDGVGLYFHGTFSQFLAELAVYAPGVAFTADDYKWCICNKEKGFKALSQSIKPGTEFDGNMTLVAVTARPETDGFAAISIDNPFVAKLGLTLGELFQIRGLVAGSSRFGYVKGCTLVCASADLVKIASLVFGMSGDELEFVRRNVNSVVLGTTDVAKRQIPGTYHISNLAANAFGHDKESGDVILGIQAMLRHYGAASETNPLLAEAILKLLRTDKVLRRCLNEWSEEARFELLDMLKQAAVVLQKPADDDSEDDVTPAAMTQDYNEVISILSRPGAKLADCNRQGKLTEMVQSVLRSSFRKRAAGYRAYAVPACIIEAISGCKMSEGEVYMPADIMTKMKIKAGNYINISRDPKLQHALIPGMVSPITTYVRGIAFQCPYLALLMQADFDGDTFTIVAESVAAMDRIGALAAIKANMIPAMAWDGKLETLPCSTIYREVPDGTTTTVHKYLAASKIVPIFGSWDKRTKCFVPVNGEAMPEFEMVGDSRVEIEYAFLWGKAEDYPSDICEDTIATISAILSASGIELGDAVASNASFDGEILPWDRVQFIQKIVEGVKHGSGGLVPNVELLRKPELTEGIRGGSFIFALKSKAKGAANKWIGLFDSLLAGADVLPVHPAVQPLVDIGIGMAELFTELAMLPKTENMVCTSKLVSNHDRALHWIMGNPIMSSAAGVRFGNSEFSLHGEERLMHPYLLALLQRRYEREFAKTMAPELIRNAVEAKTGAPMISIAVAKRTTKAKFIKFASWLAFMHQSGLRLPAPDGTVAYGNSGRVNYTYTTGKLQAICDIMRNAGLNWESSKDGKANALFAFEAKYPSHFEGLNDLIDASVDADTALGILASYMFRCGTCGLADDGKPKPAYLYFIGEYVTMKMASMLIARGKEFICPEVGTDVAGYDCVEDNNY